MYNVMKFRIVNFIFTGHSSDGDVRRRLVMLEAVQCGDVTLPDPNFSVRTNYHNLADQDYIHNIKKLINPLDHTKKDIRIGWS